MSFNASRPLGALRRATKKIFLKQKLFKVNEMFTELWNGVQERSWHKKDVKCNLRCSTISRCAAPRMDERHSKVIKFNGFSYLFDFSFGLLMPAAHVEWRSTFDLCELQNVRKRQKGKQTSGGGGGFAGKTSFQWLFISEESRSQKVLAINRKSPLMAVMDRISFVSAVARIAFEWIKCCFLIIGLLIGRSVDVIVDIMGVLLNEMKSSERDLCKICLFRIFRWKLITRPRCTATETSNQNKWRGH